MLNDKFLQRFEELQKESDSLPFEQDGRIRYVRSGRWQKWATSCQSLIRAVFGEESPHYANFVEALKKCVGYAGQVHAVQGVFQSAKEDFEGGYVFNVDLRISGEVFGDFVVLAQQSLAEGYKDVAAVLASAALEDALKRYAKAEGLNIDRPINVGSHQCTQSKRVGVRCTEITAGRHATYKEFRNARQLGKNLRAGR